MEQQIVILPGTPDDENREYLPEIIKTTDTVVNENGNNSQVYPERLKEYKEALADDMEDIWYEYVPASYDENKKTPLVIGMHGGLMTGWGQAIYTSWTMMADRDGFICIFPNANKRRLWTVECKPEECDPKTLETKPDAFLFNQFPEKIEDNHDIKFVLALIELMKEKYNIDAGRIFMQGMSLGNMMTGQFSRYFGNILAGAAGAGGPSDLHLIFDDDGKINNRAGHLAIWQSRPELNGLPPGKWFDEYRVNTYNRLYWMRLNGCEFVPQISIKGEYNYAFYKGKKADLVYLDIKNRDHGQTLDDAALVWDYFFSGVKRHEDGTITCTETIEERKGDEFSISVADGCKKAWLNNSIVEMSSPAIKWQKLKYHGLDGGQKVRGEYLCVPLSFIADIFGAEYEKSDDTLSAVLKLKDGRRLQFARGSIGCVVDNSIRSMYCEALHRNDELHISIEWFCSAMYDLHVSSYEGVTYVTDHFSILSMNMADLIRDLLNDRPVPEDYDSWI
ncbi:MAG: hypothetical protein AB1Z23_07180 [Eubacteriales bacterium]